VANPQPVTIRALTETILSASGKTTAVRSVPPSVAAVTSFGLNLLCGDRSPLNRDRLRKLTRSNCLSVAAFVAKFNFQPAHELKVAIAHEISWARAENIL
jgi:hypothetical protein